MYLEFGSKQALFDAALARYEATVLEQLCGPLEAAHRHALTNARRQGRLCAGVSVADDARRLAASTLGIFVLVRGRAAPAFVRGATRAARAQLQRLTVPAEA